MTNFLKKYNNFLKLINKIQKHGKKYKIYLLNLKSFYLFFYLYKYYNINFDKLHNLLLLNIEINNNVILIDKKNISNVTLILSVKNKLKVFIKIFKNLLNIQLFRNLKFRYLFILNELFFYFINNIFSEIKKKIKVKKKKSIGKNKGFFLGNLKLLNMFNIILVFLITIFLILIIKQFIFIKNIFFKFFRILIYIYNSIYKIVLNFFFKIKINKKNNITILKPFFEMFNSFIFFQFGSKKHTYYKIWFNNIKRYKNWIWNWRN